MAVQKPTNIIMICKKLIIFPCYFSPIVKFYFCYIPPDCRLCTGTDFDTYAEANFWSPTIFEVDVQSGMINRIYINSIIHCIAYRTVLVPVLQRRCHGLKGKCVFSYGSTVGTYLQVTHETSDTYLYVHRERTYTLQRKKHKIAGQCGFILCLAA
jgi:hypothetical protein